MLLPVPEQPADLVQRVVLVPAPTERVLLAATADLVSSWASASVAHVIAREVSTARGAINSCISDQVPVGQSGSAQRQTRFNQMISTETPSMARRRRSPCVGHDRSPPRRS